MYTTIDYEVEVAVTCNEAKVKNRFQVYTKIYTEFASLFSKIPKTLAIYSRNPVRKNQWNRGYGYNKTFRLEHLSD